MQSTNILTNVSIEVAPDYFLVGGTYDEKTLFENVRRFAYANNGDGVLSIQGNYSNGNVFLWTKDEGFTILTDSDSISSNYLAEVKIKNQVELIGSHVLDKSGEWGHGRINRFAKNQEGDVVAVVNFPINADQGWEVHLLASQIKRLPDNILLSGYSSAGKKVVDSLDITQSILSLEDEDDISFITDEPSKLQSILPDLDIPYDEISKIQVVDSICAYFGKTSKRGSIPENLVDDGVIKQLKVITRNPEYNANINRKI